MNQAEELELAIMARAERLASEYHERARRARDQILREAAERLRMREAREEGIAKSLGDRTFRQLVQASELKMQTHLDRTRWNLVQAVERRLEGRMRTFIEDQARYRDWLTTVILTSVEQIEASDLVISLAQRDQALLATVWDELIARLPADKQARLDETDLDTIGGVLILSGDRRIRVDQTFEGRLERLRPRIQQVILERLLPSGFDTANLFTG